MKPRQKRLAFVGLAILGIGAASALALTALQSNISYFFSPSQVLANEAPPDHVFRLGGLVTEGTVVRVFYADEVLAKHDEEYMPPEVASTLKTAHAEGVTNTAEANGAGASN